MLPLTGKDVHRFTPPARDGEADAPVYLIATPSPIGRARYRQALIAEGLRYWSRKAFCAAARAWLEEIGPDNLDDLLDVVGGVEALDESEPAGGLDTGDAGEAARDDDEAAARAGLLIKWGEISAMLAEQSPRVAKMAADNKLFLDAAPYIAASMFLQGWENLPATFRRGPDRLVPMELLAELDEADLGAAWLKIMSLMNVTAAQRKNSASPSGPRDTAIPSTTTEPRTAEPRTAEARMAEPGTSTARKRR